MPLAIGASANVVEERLKIQAKADEVWAVD
jgi:hypothetical protein